MRIFPLIYARRLYREVLPLRSATITGPAETVGQVGHLPYHFLVVHTGNDVAMTYIRDSEVG